MAQQIWIKAENRKPPALGETITPTAVQASSSDTGSAANNLINGNGLRDLNLDGLSEHRGDPTFMWRSAKSETKGWVEFDLGKPRSLSAISVWNYNDTWHTNRGVRQMSISAWMPETGWQRVRGDQLLDQAEGGDGYDEPTVITLGATTAQKVRFDDLVNFGDPDYIGLSEVQFFGPRGAQAANPSSGHDAAGSASSAPSLVSQR